MTLLALFAAGVACGLMVAALIYADRCADDRALAEDLEVAALDALYDLPSYDKGRHA